MTLLPSPIPHPLDHCPFDVPGWAYEALESVVELDWPAGNESATWDVADRWFALARTLADPHDEAIAAAAEIMVAYDGDARRGLAGDPSPSLDALVEIAADVGALVEECGRSLEAAKLEAWIEIGLFLTELVGMTISAALTLGAASPAAGGLIAATRLTIRQILQRLVAEMRGGASISGRTPGAPVPSSTSDETVTRRLFPPASGSPGGPEAAEGRTTVAQSHPADSVAPTVANLTAPRSPAQIVSARPAEDTIGPPDARHLAGSPAGPTSGDRPGQPASARPSARINAEGVLRRSYGMTPAAPREVGDGATRRISRTELERVARSNRDGVSSSADPGARTVRISAPARPIVPFPRSGEAPLHDGGSSHYSDAASTPFPAIPALGSSPPSSSADATASPLSSAHFGYVADGASSYDENRREEYIGFLTTIAEGTRIKIRDLARLADREFLGGSTLRGEELRKRVNDLRVLLGEIDTEAARLDGLPPATPRVSTPRVSTPTASTPTASTPTASAVAAPHIAELAAGGVLSDDHSALTGADGPPPVSQTRRYDTYGGLRAPLAVQQKTLEDAVPKAGDGRASRLPDPRKGQWFGLANDGGPGADPARGLNCIDGVLALFDTYLHGRPRVAAPRTFDAYAHGDPNRPTGGEWHGLQRVAEATGSTFQNLCPFLGAADPATAKPAVDAAMQNLANHMHNTGHGAFAFILTDLEGGGCHAWAAINHDGTILFLDPQIARISENAPLYTHRGAPSPSNVISMDALVVDAHARPAPLPYHGPGQWSTSDGPG